MVFQLSNWLKSSPNTEATSNLLKKLYVALNNKVNVGTTHIRSY